MNDPMQMVDGKVAGVVVNSVAAADPNKSGSIQVRGASSLKAGNSPLIVIDGMPGGDLRNLAQSDIESITVLKDGSAAAIYGSRGANGVILVTTKQGKAGKTTITYDGYVEHDFVASKPDVLDAEAYLDKVTGAVDYGHRTNWYDELINKIILVIITIFHCPVVAKQLFSVCLLILKVRKDWISLLIVKNTVYVETLSIRLWRGCWK